MSHYYDYCWECNKRNESCICEFKAEHKEESYDGLKVKYRVFKVKNGEPVENCFVLRPDKDAAAVAALQAYCEATNNKILANDIFNWVGKLNGHDF